MFATIYRWTTLLALLQGAFATLGSVQLFVTSQVCSGSYTECGPDLREEECCGAKTGSAYTSVLLSSPTDSAVVYAYPETSCGGTPELAAPGECFVPDSGFYYSVNWDQLPSRRSVTNATKECRTPNSIVLVEDDGTKTRIPIPEGQYEAYEQALFKNDNYEQLKKLAKSGVSGSFNSH